MNVEDRLSKQCQRLSETGSRRNSPPFTQVPKCVRAPLAPEGTLPQERQMWPGPPSVPPPEGEDASRSDHILHSAREVELRYQQDDG